MAGIFDTLAKFATDPFNRTVLPQTKSFVKEPFSRTVIPQTREVQKRFQKNPVSLVLPERREQQPIAPSFLEKSLPQQLVSGEVASQARTRIGNVFASLSEAMRPTEEEAKKQLLVQIPGSDRYVDPMGLIGGLKKVGGKAIKQIDNLTKNEMIKAIDYIRLKKPYSQVVDDIDDPIKKITAAIKGAKPLREQQEALYSAERARRVARTASVGQRIPGEAGFRAQLGQLKGELPKVQFEAIRKSFKQTDVDTLFDRIEKAPDLLTLEKITGKGALAKLFEGSLPTRSELNILRQVFPKDMIDAILSQRPVSQKVMEGIMEVVNLPRALMASFDLSGPLRQGFFAISRPRRFVPAFRDMFKYAFSEKAYQGLLDDIKARPNYKSMKQSGLSLTEIGGDITRREEAFMSNLGERIPGVGRGVRFSNRAYTGFLNKLRADVFDDFVKKGRQLGITDDRYLESASDFINAATGRGKFGLAETLILPKAAERAAPALNTLLFSPRLMASRLNLLSPGFYIKLHPQVRKEALKNLLTIGALTSSVLGLAKLGGAEVGADPRSSDFGKIKVGNTRYDILAGFQQYIRLASQLAIGEIVSSTTGRTMTLGEGYRPLTRKDIFIRFFESKQSPIASFATALATGTNFMGEDVRVSQEIVSRFLPMVTSDMYDLWKENGLEGLVMGLPAPFGVGVQTYGRQELVIGENPIGEQTAQIRPIEDLEEAIINRLFGKQPLGSSKSYSVEAYYNQMKELPTEEASSIFQKIVEINPELAKKISKVAEEEKLGITVKDKDLKAKSVASGDRAKAVLEELNKKQTQEEKSVLWEEYVEKGIITDEVGRQIKILLHRQ